MVARYSNKRAKYTYAERVLGALSEIQKDHRKHAVHMATLRAHVRKTADARKDKMGPQWAQWVSRTVNRLVDDGILDTTDAHGNITFTPDAKKTITKVRRESMGPGVALSPGLEHKIWKDVTRRFSGVGVKRSRRRSSAVPAHASDDGNWVDEDGRPRKRQARKSTSRKTKAELESELRDALERLQIAQELEPIDAEELAVLQEELSKREKEVAVLREELVRLKDQPSPIDRRVTVGASTRMVTPPPSNPSLPSSSGRPSTSTRSRLAMHGVTRTLSGSLISNLSKQPTPEPSDEGSQRSDEDIGELVYDDMEDASMSVFPEIERFSRPQQHPHGLATPQSSPLLADQEGFDPQDDIYEHERGGDGPADQVTNLKGELESQSAALEYLREEHQRLLLERDELQTSVASRDDRIHALQARVRTRDEALASQEAHRTGLEKSLAEEIGQRKQLQSALKAAEAVLSNERERSAAIEQKMSVELASLNDQLRTAQDASRTLTKSLEASNTLLSECTTELERARTTLSETQSELAEAQLALGTATASQATMTARIAELERDLEGTQERARALHIAKAALEHTSGDLQETVEQLRGELSHAKAQLESTRVEVQQAQDVINDLRASYARAQADASVGADALAASQATISSLQSTVDKLRSQLQDAAAEAAQLHQNLETEQVSRRVAESELVSTQANRDELLAGLADKTAALSSATEELAEVRRVERELRRQLTALEDEHASELAARAAERSAFEASLEIARTERAGLEAQIEQLDGRLSAVSEKLASALTERDALSAELQETSARMASLQEQLELAQNDIREAEEEIEELRSAKAEDERSIQSLKAGLSKLRQLQMDALNEVDSKMISAHTAPTPGSRRRSSIAPRLSAGTQL